MSRRLGFGFKGFGRDDESKMRLFGLATLHRFVMGMFVGVIEDF
jgi:hypothetical protein